MMRGSSVAGQQRHSLLTSAAAWRPPTSDVGAAAASTRCRPAAATAHSLLLCQQHGPAALQPLWACRSMAARAAAAAAAPPPPSTQPRSKLQAAAAVEAYGAEQIQVCCCCGDCWPLLPTSKPATPCFNHAGTLPRPTPTCMRLHPRCCFCCCCFTQPRCCYCCCRCWRGWTLCASGQACTSAAPARAACTTWCVVVAHTLAPCCCAEAGLRHLQQTGTHAAVKTALLTHVCIALPPWHACTYARAVRAACCVCCSVPAPHTQLWEVLDNAVDEVQGGWGDEVTVSVDTGTQAVTITDNGR